MESYRTCVDHALEKLKRLYDKLPQNPHLKNPIQTAQLDLRFFKMFFWGFESWEEAGIDLHTGSVLNTMENELRQIAWNFEADCGELMSSPLMQKMMQFKPQVRESCSVFLAGAFKCKSFENEELCKYPGEAADFIFFILRNLEVLNSTANLIAPLKRQTGFIQEKLKLFGNFAQVVFDLMIGGKLDEFLLHTRTWANHISCLACLYWIDGMDESQESLTMGTALSDLMQKTMLYTPEVITLYLDVLKATRYYDPGSETTHELCQLGARYVDFLLENLDEHMKKDDIETIREGLIFLLTFIMDPPEDLEDSGLILKEVDAIIAEVPSAICSIHSDNIKAEISVSETKFSEFLGKIHSVKAEISETYVLITHSSQSNSPRTNPMGFFDFLLGNLKNMLSVKENIISSLKHRVMIVLEELASLRPFLQNDHEEFKDLWARIINLLYYAEYVTNFCSVIDVPVWYSIICLSNVREDIQLIKIDVKSIVDAQVYCKRLIAVKKSNDALLPQVNISRSKEGFIGFKESERLILDSLVGGRKELTIISLSGMPGIGKTTLAKRIYDDRSIQYHFHKIVWCYISKECQRRELLIEMVRDVSKGYLSDVDMEEFLKKEIEDLVGHVRKRLKGKRYLIVMDDIWDVDVWHDVERSFPDDRNGSRILFTSRNHNLASQAKPASFSHHLQLFSDEESWELIKEKLFYSDNCTPEFSEIGKQIATYCKGLPLAVSLIASVLGRMDRKLDLWKQVGENLKYHLASEGCGKIIELSYKYLPDHLKPCFLYFGAFPRGKYVRATKLKLLWIAEGFIKENGMERSEDLAKEYLDNLVSQNLVVLAERSSMGGIKTCNVHDLLYDLCLEKAVEENFLQLADKSVLDQCSFSLQKYNHYRLCIGTRDPFTKPRPICTRAELPTGQVHSLVCSGDDSWTLRKFSFLDSFKVITVLDLEGIYVGDDFPEPILLIVRLRYLAIWARIKKIPASMASLWNLETLIIRGKRSVKLSETILRMKTLRHVRISVCWLEFGESEEEDTSTMYNIETLGSPVFYYDRDSEKFLRRLPKLRKLSCQFPSLFHPRRLSWLSEFRHLKELQTLRLGFHGISTSPSNSWNNTAAINFPENLKKLSLSGFELPWSFMSTIGKMPNLEVLKLEKNACCGKIWELEDGVEFPKLRFLKLCELDVEQINVSSGCEFDPFSCLEELIVDACCRLREISSSFGDISTLKSIKLFQSSLAKPSVGRILRKQRDMGNENLQVVTRRELPHRLIDRDFDYADFGIGDLDAMQFDIAI